MWNEEWLYRRNPIPVHGFIFFKKWWWVLTQHTVHINRNDALVIMEQIPFKNAGRWDLSIKKVNVLFTSWRYNNGPSGYRNVWIIYSFKQRFFCLLHRSSCLKSIIN